MVEMKAGNSEAMIGNDSQNNVYDHWRVPAIGACCEMVAVLNTRNKTMWLGKDHGLV